MCPDIDHAEPSRHAERTARHHPSQRALRVRPPRQHGRRPAPLHRQPAGLFGWQGPALGHPARLAVRPVPRGARPHDGPLAREPERRAGQRRQAGLLPVDGIPDRPRADQRTALGRPARRGPRSLHPARRRFRRADRPRARPRPGQRRPRPAGRLLPRLHGHPGRARHGLRHPLRLRHVRAAHRRRPPGRGARLLAGRRQPLGIHAARVQLHRAVRRPSGAGGRPCALDRHRRRDRHRLRQRRARPRADQRGHAAPVDRTRDRGHQPRRLQQGRLHARGGGQEPVGKRLARALPRRLHRARQGTAPAPGVLLRQRLAAGHPAPLPQAARRL